MSSFKKQNDQPRRLVLAIAYSVVLTTGVATLAAIYITITQPVSRGSIAAATILSDATWQSLSGNTAIDIPGVMGRANPFLPTGSAGDTAAGRDTLRVRDLIILSAALASFRQLEGHYPAGNLLPLGEGNALCLNDQGWVHTNACAKSQQTYLPNVPHDPGSTQYLYTGSDDTYSIGVRLETGRGKLSSWDFTPADLRK